MSEIKNGGLDQYGKM